MRALCCNLNERLSWSCVWDDTKRVDDSKVINCVDYQLGYFWSHHLKGDGEIWATQLHISLHCWPLCTFLAWLIVFIATVPAAVGFGFLVNHMTKASVCLCPYTFNIEMVIGMLTAGWLKGTTRSNCQYFADRSYRGDPFYVQLVLMLLKLYSRAWKKWKDWLKLDAKNPKQLEEH